MVFWKRIQIFRKFMIYGSVEVERILLGIDYEMIRLHNQERMVDQEDQV